MRLKRAGTFLSLVAMLSACGGGGGGGSGDSSSAPPVAGPTPPPPATPPPTAGCSLTERQNWALAQLKEWYLFPETLPAAVPAQPTLDAYINALTATARAQGRDRFFTYVTSIAEENAFFASGSTAGFGIRLALDSAQSRLFVSEAYEGAPALAAGIDRGAEIVAIGTSTANLKTVSSILATEGSAGLSAALGPSTVGTTRLLRVTDASGTRDVTLSKVDFELSPISSRYGAKIIEDGGRRVGYLNMRTFISTADPALRQAFASFRSAGLTEIIVDFRYNGGGLVSTSQLMGDLLGGNRSTSDILSVTAFRPEKSNNNSTRFFSPQPQSVSPMRLAFIGTGSTASASEFVINAFVPYLQERAALIGTNTFGKPVGQIALDRAACDDRLRVVAFASKNAAGQGDYFSGLASTVKASCQAADDLTRPLGDPQENSTRKALDFLAGKSCTPINAGASAQSVSSAERRDLLSPENPSPAQREVPGSF